MAEALLNDVQLMESGAQVLLEYFNARQDGLTLELISETDPVKENIIRGRILEIMTLKKKLNPKQREVNQRGSATNS